MTEPERPPEIVLAENAPLLALLATRGLYEEQPALWKLGERGRKHTLEDFNHHFRALQTLSVPAFRGHVEYCDNLFDARGYPRTWLQDAWRWMAIVIERELPAPVAERALGVLNEVVSAGSTG
jgi:hypothetical protein